MIVDCCGITWDLDGIAGIDAPDARGWTFNDRCGRCDRDLRAIGRLAEIAARFVMNSPDEKRDQEIARALLAHAHAADGEPMLDVIRDMLAHRERVLGLRVGDRWQLALELALEFYKIAPPPAPTPDPA